MTALLNSFISFPTGGGVGGLPPGATSQLRFTDAFYYSGGSTQAISALLGGGFDAGAISGLGMRITPSNGNEPAAIGDWFTDITAGIAAGCTVLFDVSSAISPAGFLIFIGDDVDFGVADEALIANADAAIFDYWDLFLTDSISGSGLHKIALTLARDVGGGDYEYALCSDGNTAATQTVNYLTHVSPINTILFGHDGAGTGNTLNDIYIRSITLYPAMLPADLPALTA